MDPPGRFLKKNGSGLWQVVTDKVAKYKVKKELRDAVVVLDQSEENCNHMNDETYSCLCVGNFQVDGNELVVTAPVPRSELQQRMAGHDGGGGNNEDTSGEAASLSKEPKMPAEPRNGLCESQRHAQQQLQGDNNGDGVDDDETISDTACFGQGGKDREVGASSLTEQSLGGAWADSKQLAAKKIRTCTSKRPLKRKAASMEGGDVMERMVGKRVRTTNASCAAGTNPSATMQIQLLNAELSKIKVQLAKVQLRLRLDFAPIQQTVNVSNDLLTQQLWRKCNELEEQNSRQRLELEKMVKSSYRGRGLVGARCKVMRILLPRRQSRSSMIANPC